ncbi:MAG: ATP-dependent Clp protease adaptor ClpS [Flavobacteriaceae bacterium]|nr:ATP-dependent Clp protease adaptor ClpS [Flavobacteriaceae bacterium]
MSRIKFPEKQAVQKTIKSRQYSLILFNDDFNTFDHVIDCLIKHCKHARVQAEQCTYIVHYNGKCEVKSGPLDKLKTIGEKLEQEGLTVEIF